MTVSDHAVRTAAETRRDVDAAYRRRYGRERPGPRWSDEACAAWRAAHRAAGMTNAWTHTPVDSAAALLITLADLGRSNGTALAREAGVAQGHATAVSLPRFERMGLVDREEGDDVEGAVGRTGRPTRWIITPAGRKLAAALVAGVLR